MHLIDKESQYANNKHRLIGILQYNIDIEEDELKKFLENDKAKC